TRLSDTYSPFSFNAPPPTDLSTLSLHDALPISGVHRPSHRHAELRRRRSDAQRVPRAAEDQQDQNRREFVQEGHRLHSRDDPLRSEEHTSELQSRGHLVCRLLLEKKKNEIVELQ